MRALGGGREGRASAVYALCALGELGHVRISNAIRIDPAEVAAFKARSRAIPGSVSPGIDDDIAAARDG
jgi:hypothetical protein